MRHDVRQLRKKPLEYFKIQESLRSENLTKCIIYMNIFMFFSTLKDIIQAQSKLLN